MLNEKASKTRHEKTFTERSSSLERAIREANEKLERLQHKRKLHLGKVCFENGLENFSDETLIREFKQLAKRLSHEQLSQTNQTNKTEINKNGKGTLQPA